MYIKNVSPYYFMFIFFCFKPGKVRNNVAYFFPFRKGLALIFFGPISSPPHNFQNFLFSLSI